MFFIQVFETVVFCPGDFQKRVIFAAVVHDPGKIGGSSAVTGSFVRCVQTVGRNKVTVFAADLRSLGVHHIRKFSHGSADAFRNDHSGIIMRLQHKGIQQIFQIKTIPLGKTAFCLRIVQAYSEAVQI